MSDKENINLLNKIFVAFIFVIATSVGLFGQPTYMMTNATVDDCEGTLLDSENGPEDGQYNHNENYVFTICQDDADEIVFTFDFFATEETYDVMTIYDGPDTNSVVLGVLSGVIQPPPSFVATSGCITIHFVSDDNIVATGWSASWTMDLDEPVPPELMAVGTVECPLQTAVFTFDTPIDCGNFDPANFSIVGPSSGSIVQVNPLDCDMATNLGQQFEIVLSNAIVIAGSYRLLFNGSIQDDCGEWHDVSANVLFDLSNCPIEVEIELVEAACGGDCGTVRVNIIGSSSPVYEYDWSHTGLNQEEVLACTDDSLYITVTVTDPVTMQTATDDFWYYAMENPVFFLIHLTGIPSARVAGIISIR